MQCETFELVVLFRQFAFKCTVVSELWVNEHTVWQAGSYIVGMNVFNYYSNVTVSFVRFVSMSETSEKVSNYPVPVLTEF